MGRFAVFVTLALLASLSNYAVLANDNGDYEVGVGIADLTGPAAAVGMMGYASLSQSAQGIHTRLYSRAFVFRSGKTMVVFVSADIAMLDQGLKYKVVEMLQEKYGNIFSTKNVLLSATHTHSSPGAYLQYLMYGITTNGFLEESFIAIADGMVESIEKAYLDLQPGKAFYGNAEVLDANINRSPTAYALNPKDERDRYAHTVDKSMELVRIEKADGAPLGMVNWFPVHPTSMNNTNRLLSGDNKGYASMLFERKMNPGARPGQGPFVAAFASSNLGDVSPNIEGPKCRGIIDDATGEEMDCDPDTSMCPLKAFPGVSAVTNCIAFGPGTNGDMEESTKIIGERQFLGAEGIFERDSLEQLKGDVQFVQNYINMSRYAIEKNSTGHVTKGTCPGALGRSFAAGTTDGPGLFFFKQNDDGSDAPWAPIWDIVRNLLKWPTKELLDCHLPKPVLLPVGEAHFPYDWVASVVEVQLFRVGNFYILGIPGELTTMAGRRLREKVATVIKAANPSGGVPHVVTAGLSSTYTHYITTKEEYQKQRYEGASNLYGPNTLDAYMHQFEYLVWKMFVPNTIVPEVSGPPPYLIANQWSNIPKITLDTPMMGRPFGYVLAQPLSEVTIGDTVRVQFAGGHLRHNPMRGGTFLLVEKSNADGSQWTTVATDADWNTKLRWSRPPGIGSRGNIIDITWKTYNATEAVSFRTTATEAGFYRIRHFGHYKLSTSDALLPYNGVTATFEVKV